MSTILFRVRVPGLAMNHVGFMVKTWDLSLINTSEDDIRMNTIPCFVRVPGLEPGTSVLSGLRSNHLS